MEVNLQKYKAFIETVECGSFTKAADKLAYSQSGISRMIRELEEEWGVSLLERSRAGVRLTSDGMKLLPYVKNVCAEYQKLQMQADELNGIQSGLIRVGTFSSVATYWLPKMIRECQRLYPHVEFELLLGDYTEIEDWIATGRVDFGFLRLPTRPEFETEFLEQDSLLAVLPERHPLAENERVPVKSLCAEPFILLEKGAKAEIAEIFARCGLKPDVRIKTWDDYAVMSMVELGLGVSILPRLILQRIPYRVASRELDVPAYRNIGLALRDRKNASVAVKRFLEYVCFR